jgi:hypothetical protein
MANNDLNIIMLVGIHTVLTAIATENFGKALLVSGTTTFCFLMFTGVVQLARKINKNSGDYNPKNEKRKRQRHNNLKKYSRYRKR